MYNPDVYDSWNMVKKSLEQKDKPLYFRQGQIWWCNIGKNLGVEIYGKGKTFSRPVLVFKKLSTNSFLGIPLTTKIKNGARFKVIKHKGRKISLIFGQIRALDIKRLTNQIGEIDDEDFRQTKKAFSAFIDL